MSTSNLIGAGAKFCTGEFTKLTDFAACLNMELKIRILHTLLTEYFN